MKRVKKSKQFVKTRGSDYGEQQSVEESKKSPREINQRRIEGAKWQKNGS